MFKKPTKRQFIIRRILVSSLATLSVIIIATVTILFMLGFRLDGTNGRLEQGALLQFDSSPNGAYVMIDDELLGGRTATKQTVIAGTHTIRMTRDGYQDWSRTLTLAAGTLTWLDYTRFVPENRPVSKVTTYSSLAGMTISPDKKWSLVHEVSGDALFKLVDLRSESVRTTELALPVTSYAEAETEGVAHSFGVTSWDSGSRYVLVKHIYNDQTEWLVVDTQDAAQTISASQLLSVGFKDLQFASTNGKVLYGLSEDGTIRKLDLSAATISRAFVSHVDSFSVFDNTILTYTGTDSTDATKRVAGVYRDGDESAHVLRSVTDPDTVLKIATGRYFSDDYVAIAENNVVTILKGNYPSSSTQDNSSLSLFAGFEMGGAVSSLSFSPKGDYVMAQSGENYKTYEIEHERVAVGMVAVDDGAPVSKLKWLDVAHMWNDDGGILTMRDFDGSNIYSIMAVTPGFDASLSQNGRFFYAIGQDDAGYHLQRVKMVLD